MRIRARLLARITFHGLRLASRVSAPDFASAVSWLVSVTSFECFSFCDLGAFMHSLIGLRGCEDKLVGEVCEGCAEMLVSDPMREIPGSVQCSADIRVEVRSETLTWGLSRGKAGASTRIGCVAVRDPRHGVGPRWRRGGTDGRSLCPDVGCEKY